MNLISPEERVAQTAELLQSLHNSVRELRQQAEDLKQRIQTGQDAEMPSGSKQVASAEGLIRACQKVEANLVEQVNRQSGIVQGGYALDLDKARFEIGCRLARIRACCAEGSISE